MLFWRRLATVGALLAVLAGCESAHIKDAYISRDSDGVRRTDCIRPNWRHYYLIVELMSFSEDTLLWPFLTCERGDCETVFRPGVVAPPFAEGPEELVEFGNIAPGKSEQDFTLELTEWEPNAEGQMVQRDLTGGQYRWLLYLDDEEEPRESLPLTIAPDCPCVGSVVGCE